MRESFRPSKQFLVRGGIAIGIVAIVLVVQTDWFRAIFHKAPLAPIGETQTVGDLVTKDSNNNGVADWEEKLWGLDPTTLYTNGVPNAQIIAQKKEALGISSAENKEPQNETDALARELFAITTALGQSGQVTNETLSAIATKLADSIEFKKVADHYSLKDLSTVQTTKQSLSAYYDRMAVLARTYNTDTAEMDVVIAALETGDTSDLPKLEQTKVLYQNYTTALRAVSVPVGIEDYHLELINSLYGLSVSFQYLTELADNSANALTGIVLYRINDARLSIALTNIHDYLVRYGILDS